MSGHVELGYDPDATVASVGNNVAHFCLRVIAAVRTLPVKFRKLAALDAKSLIIGKVLVQNVQLDGAHGINVALNYGSRNPAP